jgi:hypothetical protein
MQRFDHRWPLGEHRVLVTVSDGERGKLECWCHRSPDVAGAVVFVAWARSCHAATYRPVGQAVIQRDAGVVDQDVEGSDLIGGGLDLCR